VCRGFLPADALPPWHHHPAGSSGASASTRAYRQVNLVHAGSRRGFKRSHRSVRSSPTSALRDQKTRGRVYQRAQSDRAVAVERGDELVRDLARDGTRCTRAAKLAPYRDVPRGADGSTAVSGVGELPPFPHTLPSAETVFRPRLMDDRPEQTQGEAFLSHLSPPPRSSVAVARCRARVSRLKPSLVVAGTDPGQGAARQGTTTTALEKTARAVPQSLGEGRPGRLWGRIGFFSREGRVVTNLPQVGVETTRKVR
jgi:hypothetical protein